MKDFIFSYLLSYFYFFIMFYYEAGRFFPTDSVTPRWGKKCLHNWQVFYWNNFVILLSLEFME